ncbi:hypothetical protein D5086_026606 [Populus alba]|uniref:Uncharacterized protein n=1 Tax=Populus alba TaxID=43335 RepID=A0ACC4B2T5_POPAL
MILNTSRSHIGFKIDICESWKSTVTYQSCWRKESSVGAWVVHAGEQARLGSVFARAGDAERRVVSRSNASPRLLYCLGRRCKSLLRARGDLGGKRQLLLCVWRSVSCSVYGDWFTAISAMFHCWDMTRGSC